MMWKACKEAVIRWLGRIGCPHTYEERYSVFQEAYNTHVIVRDCVLCGKTQRLHLHGERSSLARAKTRLEFTFKAPDFPI